MISRNRQSVCLALSIILLTSRALVAQGSGSLDPTFDGDGLVVVPASVSLNAVAVQADGKCISVGREVVGSTYQWVIYRHDAGGALDATFGTAGKVSLFAAANSQVNAQDVRIDASGRCLVAGASLNGNTADYTIVRLAAANGSLDTSFGSAGIVKTHLGSRPKDNSIAQALAIQPDSKIVLAGWAGGVPGYGIGLARYLANGTLDSSFGSGGKFTDNYGSVSNAVSRGAIALQSDGKILVGFRSGITLAALETTYWMLGRYRTNGSIDTTYGSAGKVIGAFPGFTNPKVNALVVEPGDRLIAAGRVLSSTTTYDMLVARYDANGQLDSSFGGSGFVDSGLAGDDQAYGVARQSDGKFVVAGMLGLTTTEGVVLLRLHGNGTADTTFGINGVSEIAPRSVIGAGFPHVEQDPAGRLVANCTSGLARFLY